VPQYQLRTGSELQKCIYTAAFTWRYVVYCTVNSVYRIHGPEKKELWSTVNRVNTKGYASYLIWTVDLRSKGSQAFFYLLMATNRTRTY